MVVVSSHRSAVLAFTAVVAKEAAAATPTTPTTPTIPTTPTTPGVLSNTGVDSTVGFAALFTLLTAAGIGLMMIARRRRPS